MKSEFQEERKPNLQKYENQTSGSMEIELQEVRKPNLQKYENQTSGISKIKLAEVRKSNPINTDINDTEKNETISSYLSLYTGQIGKYSMDRMDACRRIVRQNISYDVLVHDGIYGVSELDEIVELIVDVMMLPDEMSVRIGGSEKMAAVIKNRFMRLTMMHITYVLDCLRNNTSKVGNIKAYVLTSLYNATMTIDHYYQAEVGYDLHGVG